MWRWRLTGHLRSRRAWAIHGGGDSKAWFASFVEADGDEAADDPLEVTSVTSASNPDEVAEAISAAVSGL